MSDLKQPKSCTKQKRAVSPTRQSMKDREVSNTDNGICTELLSLTKNLHTTRRNASESISSPMCDWLPQTCAVFWRSAPTMHGALHICTNDLEKQLQGCGVINPTACPQLKTSFSVSPCFPPPPLSLPPLLFSSPFQNHIIKSRATTLALPPLTRLCTPLVLQ